MNIEGLHSIAANRARVWAAINDPDVLLKCIKGCESLVEISEDKYEIVLVTKIGPIKAKFKGKLTIFDSNPIESYAMRFEAVGGLAGFGKGVAMVKLEEVAAEETVLSYVVTTELGGKLAQLGARLVMGVAKNMAEDFFTKFTAYLSGDLTEIECEGQNAG